MTPRKISVGLALAITAVVVLVLSGFAYFQVTNQRESLLDDLDRRARVVAKSLLPAARQVLQKLPNSNPVELAERLEGTGRTLGLLLLRSDGETVAISSRVVDTRDRLSTEVAQALHGESEVSFLERLQDLTLHILVFPVTDKEGKVVGTLGILHDASFIDERMTQSLTWFALIIAFLALSLATVTIAGTKLGFERSLYKFIDWMRRLRLGHEVEDLPPEVPVESLRAEAGRLAASFHAARKSALLQAERVTKEDRIWTNDRLRAHVLDTLKGTNLIVVSNREPYMDLWEHGKVRTIVPASGLVTSLDPVLRACGGVWVAHGAGNADRDTADKKGHVVVPPGDARYTLRRIWLTAEEEEGYYYGFSNEGLWPLCHVTHERPFFQTTDWEQYKRVNHKFARAVLEEIGSAPAFVLIQDFHLSIVPRLLKDERPDIAVGIFWHIPWPHPEAFQICPWKRELLHGILGADLIGFHLQAYCNNFLDTVDRILESRIDWEQFGVNQGDKMTLVRPFPISVQDWKERSVPSGETLSERIRQLKAQHRLGDGSLALGVDRIDYTKGLPDRLKAIARFLEKNPHYIGRFTYVGLGAPSRTHIKRYRDLATEVEGLADEINWRFQTQFWKPIVLLHEHHDPETVYVFMQMADLCIVSSLHDGMNLVAKEFVSAQEEGDGVLVLSEFAGATRELTNAIFVNPYNTESFADAILAALEMEPAERQRRMGQMRQIVAERNIYRWAADFINDLARITQAPSAANMERK
jgi:trehalose 6-phosphate synthase